MKYCRVPKFLFRSAVSLLAVATIFFSGVPALSVPSVNENTELPKTRTQTYEAVVSGFSEIDDTTAYTPTPCYEIPERAWDVSGEINLVSVYNISHEAPDPGATDFRGFSGLRPELDLSFQTDLNDNWRGKLALKAFQDFIYNLRGWHKYTDQVLDKYESEFELDEAYIEGAILPSLDLKAGRQVVVWGNTENFRVTDILNPADNRNPGMVDIEDLRLPVGMAKLSYYAGDYCLALLAIPEIRFDKQPVLGNDFYPLDQPLPPEDKPDSGFKNTEFAISLKGVFHGWDLSLYGAYLFNDKSHLKTVGMQDMVVGQVPLSEGGFAPVIVQAPVFRREHARLTMAGCSVNVALGSWMFKTELAFTDGLQFNTTTAEKKRFNGLVGLEYSGLTNTLIVIELVQTHLFDHESQMGGYPDYTKKNGLETAFRISRDLFHDRLHLIFLAIAMGGKAQDGAIERLTAEYELTDALAIKTGCVFYQDGDSLVNNNIHDNNRVFANLKYTF